jgi:G3E family GTPase
VSIEHWILKIVMSIPCHLIAGPLGVGKTTAIRRFVARSPEYVAVIVNDFGKTGYDASFIAEAGGADRLSIESIPGGCLCCTSAAQLLPALKLLCEKPEVERIVIEPSGVALLEPLVRLLRSAEAEFGFELRPIIVLLDPAKTPAGTLRQIPFFRSFADYAGIAVLNRCDLAAPEAVEKLFQCLEKWDPPKLRIIQTTHGELPAGIFSLRGSVPAPIKGPHHHAEVPSAGALRSECVFAFGALMDFLRGEAGRLARFKGVFNTDQGWQRIEIAGGNLSAVPAAAARQTGAEWVGCGSELADRIETLAE